MPPGAGSDKTGNSTLNLQDDAAFTGTVEVQGGRLKLDILNSNIGDLSNASLIDVTTNGAFDVEDHFATGGYTIPSGQTLRGAGTVRGKLVLADGSVIQPGDSGVGQMTIDDGDLNDDSLQMLDIQGGTFQWQMSNWDGDEGVGYDQIVINDGRLKLHPVAGCMGKIRGPRSLCCKTRPSVDGYRCS